MQTYSCFVRLLSFGLYSRQIPAPTQHTQDQYVLPDTWYIRIMLISSVQVQKYCFNRYMPSSTREMQMPWSLRGRQNVCLTYHMYEYTYVAGKTGAKQLVLNEFWYRTRIKYVVTCEYRRIRRPTTPIRTYGNDEYVHLYRYTCDVSNSVGVVCLAP